MSAPRCAFCACPSLAAPTSRPRRSIDRLARRRPRIPRWRSTADGADIRRARIPEPDDASPSGKPASAWRALLRPFRVLPIDRKIAAIALPALGSLTLDPVIALADMACVGYLGATALAAVGISNNVFNMSVTSFNFLFMTTTPGIARAFGRSDAAAASRLISQALWVAGVLGVSTMCLLSAFALPLVSFFGANASIAPAAVTYLRARIVAAPFFLASLVASGAYAGFQDTRTPFLVGISANIVNLALFPTLIFGCGLGVVGAGVATAAGQIVSGSLFLILLVRERRLRLADLRKVPKPAEVLPLLRSGAVLFARTLSLFGTLSFATATAARLGTIEVAAFEIGKQVFALFSRLHDSVSIAAQSLVALALGKGDFRGARQAANRILQLGVAVGFFFFGVFMLAVDHAPMVLTSDPAVRAMVSMSFPYIAIIQPINGIAFTMDGIYTAGRKFSSMSAGIILASCCSSGVMLLVRYFGLPLSGVWTALNSMMVLRAIFLGFGYMTKWSPAPQEKFVKAASENNISL